MNTRHSFLERLALFRKILASHYNQPATGLWRVFETEVVLDELSGEGRALDLGCGDGELAELLFASAPGLRWTGLDIDAADVELARGRRFYEQVHAAPASRIPEPDGAFDLVFSNSSLEHMDGLPEVLAEVARVLRPGGRFAFTVPARSFDELLLWRRALAKARLRSLSDRYRDSVDARLQHKNLWSAAEWGALLERQGLRLEREVPYLSSGAIAVWETLSNATGGLARLLSGGRSPREVQRAAGLLRGHSPRLAALAAALFAPALALAAAGDGGKTGALYLEARRA